MPRKSDNISINNKTLDKRVKLTDEQKQEIKENKENLSIRGLAKRYNVNKRLIQFILFPERLEHNKQLRALRGGSMAYYKKEEHTKAIKKHRDYKKELFENNLIGEKEIK